MINHKYKLLTLHYYFYLKCKITLTDKILNIIENNRVLLEED